MTSEAAVLPRPTIEEYDIEVNRGLNFDQAKAAGKYDWLNPGATAKRYPIVGSGKSKMKARLICFHRDMGDEVDESEVSNTLAAMGLKRGDAAEILAFGAQHPEVQRSKGIVSGAFSARPDGGRGFLYLYGTCNGRGLCLYGFYLGHQWPYDGWFLAVPKDS